MANPRTGKDGEFDVYPWEGGCAIIFFYADTSEPNGSEQSNSSPYVRLFLVHTELHYVSPRDQTTYPIIRLPTISGEGDIDLASLSSSTSLEATPAWALASAILDAAPRLPTGACAHCKRWIIDEIHAVTANRAAEIQHKVLRLHFCVRVYPKAPMTFEDYLVLTANQENNISEEGNQDANINDVKVEMFADSTDHAGAAEIMCAVCLDEINKGSITGRMPCGHIFHLGCIIRWIGDRNTCPMCRFRIPCKHLRTSNPYEAMVKRLTL